MKLTEYAGKLFRLAGNRWDRNARFIHWQLLAYDALFYAVVSFLLLFAYPGLQAERQNWPPFVVEILLGFGCVFLGRLIFGVYRTIWRYGTTTTYLRMILGDLLAFILFMPIRLIPWLPRLTFLCAVSLFTCNLLAAMTARIIYQFFYQTSNRNGSLYVAARKIIRIMTGSSLRTLPAAGSSSRKITIAIAGAGLVGGMLAEELRNNSTTCYRPVCFIDEDPDKVGRTLSGLPVLSRQYALRQGLTEYGVQEVVIAVSSMDSDIIRSLYETYQATGCRVKVYDYQNLQSAQTGKRQLRDFDIEELLFRKPCDFLDEETASYYRGKTVLITGGGGSIGSELCRQIARMHPKKLVVVDICENGVYDIQQELRIAYGAMLEFCAEIVSVCDKAGLEKTFDRHRPDIVLHAAAHKHVPLMENNVCEAVYNNVFGTLNTVETAEKCGVKRFIMISTDKAVNPTNVMGATKRMCEMIVLNRTGDMLCSATRFGNVLGSAGSVIPLFKKQIAAGGPVTITDKRIIRYFMTIPEASQLVLQSGAMAKQRELFVLNMGKAVKILDLAENMIRLSGFEPNRDISIVETGLRPGEKLYEELLIDSKTATKTANELIYVEHEHNIAPAEIAEKLNLLLDALKTKDDVQVRMTLKKVVPTFCDPEEVNNARKVG